MTILHDSSPHVETSTVTDVTTATEPVAGGTPPAELTLHDDFGPSHSLSGVSGERASAGRPTFHSDRLVEAEILDRTVVSISCELTNPVIREAFLEYVREGR